jgi:hypothetical protein
VTVFLLVLQVVRAICVGGLAAAVIVSAVAAVQLAADLRPTRRPYAPRHSIGRP